LIPIWFDYVSDRLFVLRSEDRSGGFFRIVTAEKNLW